MVHVCRWGDAQSPFYGDVHFYDYQADSLDPATYPQARFVSEFGFQSLPSWAAYRTVTQPQDWHWNSTMSHFRLTALSNIPMGIYDNCNIEKSDCG